MGLKQFEARSVAAAEPGWRAPEPSLLPAFPVGAADRAPRLGHRLSQITADSGAPAVAQLRACEKCGGAGGGEEVVQRMDAGGAGAAPVAASPAGIPSDLQAGVESLSGMDLSDVRVHKGSAKPRGVGALAYTQGNEVHLGPGQDEHLAHELWHVVQQRQGRVRVTTQVGGKGINDDDGLEREADAMGKRALQMRASPALQRRARREGAPPAHAAPIQGFWPFTDSHAPPANVGGRIAALQQTLNGSQPHEQASPAWYATQQDNLHQAQDDVHAWWRDHGHDATDQQRQEMTNHLYALEDHHQALVDVQLQHNHPLWLPAGTSAGDRNRANQVWGDVQNNTGNLKITQGGAAFRRQTLGGVAKLLEGAHGRDMLEELNAAQGGDANREVHIGADWSGDFALAGREHQAGSWATPKVSGTQAHRLVDANTPGAGVGSYVQIDRAHRETETGAHGTGVPMPYSLTLGHELGHALHNLRGTSAGAPSDRPAFEALPPEEQALWSNAEEHQNITQHENALRAEQGLPARAYHRPPRVVRATRMKNDLRDRIEQVSADFPEDARVRDLDPSLPGFYEQDGIDTPEFYENANQHIASLYRNRSLKRAAAAGGILAGTALAGLGLYRWLKK